mmetsp:Transcript_3827/g.8640  ORF Transcript_3827/g.8640 Transcript_3827/m.8640 type:complete len:111 (+) Transcript_3827:146-478(+)
MGSVVNYADLPHVLWEWLLPKRWNIQPTKEEITGIQKISGVYSKSSSGRKAFHADSKAKEDKATPAVREAAQLFMQESFDRLQSKRKEYHLHHHHNKEHHHSKTKPTIKT